ncbi:MAG: adenylate/guanylate cyclase domain-containing protein [Candidatus Methanomethyliaceae archaeon]
MIPFVLFCGVSPPQISIFRPKPVTGGRFFCGYFALAFVLSILSIYLCRSGGILYGYELKTLDTRYSFGISPVSSPQVLIIAIDERSLSDPSLGRWPWPRRRHAELLSVLEHDKPQVVAFDMIFADPSSHEDDVLFAQACKRAGNVFWGLHEGTERRQDPGAGAPEAFSVQVDFLAPRALLPTIRALVAPRALLANAGVGGGTLFACPDPDGVLRRGLLFVQELNGISSNIYPSLPLAIFAALHKLSFAQMQIDLRKEACLDTGYRLPLDGHGGYFVRFLGPGGTIPTISYVDVLKGRYPPGTFKNKIVLVGFTAEGLKERYPTPIDPFMSGVEIHAQMLECLLQKRFLQKLSSIGEAALTFGVASLAIVAAALWRPLRGLLFLIFILCVYNLGAIYYFGHAGILWPGLPPLLSGVGGFGIMEFMRLRSEEAGRKRLREEFSRYAPPPVVARLDAGQLQSQAAGEIRPVTVLFADLRDFTSWSARADPHQVIRVLNTYFEAMTRLAFDVEGIVDNIIGDEILVTFNALETQPDHIERAVDLALNMVAALEGLNNGWLHSEVLSAPLRLGIGINTGEVLVGRLGSHIRTQYTVLGQTVNLAARLQAYNKELGTVILCTAPVAEQVAEQVLVRSHGYHLLRGHTEPIEVFEIVNRRWSFSPHMLK